MDALEFPSGPIPVRVNQPETKDYVERYRKDVANIFALIQMAVAIFAIMLTITEMTVMGENCQITACGTGYGLWNGIIYLASGILGSCSKAFHPNKYLILSFMTMSIISASSSFIPIFFGIIEIQELLWMSRRSIIYRRTRVPDNIFVIPILLVLLFFVEVVAAIVSASLCCKAICQCCNEPGVESYSAFFDIKTQSFVFTPKPQNISEDQSQSTGASTSDLTPNNFGSHSKIIPEDILPILE